MPWLTTDQIQNYGLWLQSGAIFLTFVGVIISALVTRGVARRRATLDLIMSEQSSELMIGIRQKFLTLKQAGHLVQYAGPAQASSDETAALRAVLNRYELISIGINEKTLNSRVYKNYSRTTFVTDWIACKPFVMQRRQTMNNPKIYSEYEVLAKKWAIEGENC
jgi:Domain of unknown function (DUF4760)